MLLSVRSSRFLLVILSLSFTWFTIRTYQRNALTALNNPSNSPSAEYSPPKSQNHHPVVVTQDKKSPSQEIPPPRKHTIEKLWENAKAEHAAMIKRQSRTIEEARKEYVKRYEISPPEGYDEWFAYAMEHESLIIDEFDSLMVSLRPFRGYQENDCQFKNNREFLLSAVLLICIVNGTVDAGNPSVYDTKQITTPFIDFISEFVEELPDMCFYMNTFDEPRNVIPAEKQRILAGGLGASDQCERHEFASSRRIDVWDQVKLPCSENSAARNPNAKLLNESVALIESWDSATDLCSFNEAPPAGMLRCPENLSITSAARPVLSAASLSTFSDILFPTLWRWRFDAQGAYWVQTEDNTPWSEKVPAVGWRGSSNGGYAIQDNWRQFQRHRMVKLAGGADLQAPYALESTIKLQKWLDVHFTNIVGCEEATCEVMKSELPLAESQKLSDTFKNKIVLDMDGHGLSGRFYMLLQSDSAVMKQGIVREWHDSRLIPWLHYIPLSMGMGELEGMLDYLFEDGDHVLKSIAEESKAWAAKALRRQDMRIYMYRLMLELGRTEF